MIGQAIRARIERLRREGLRYVDIQQITGISIKSIQRIAVGIKQPSRKKVVRRGLKPKKSLVTYQKQKAWRAPCGHMITTDHCIDCKFQQG